MRRTGRPIDPAPKRMQPAPPMLTFLSILFWLYIVAGLAYRVAAAVLTRFVARAERTDPDIPATD